MKARIYLRIAKCKKGFLLRADKSPNHEPIKFGEYRPTVLIALDLDIPNKEFDNSRILLEAKIKETKSCVEIKQVETEGELENKKDHNNGDVKLK